MTAYILDRIEGQLDTLSRSEADVGRWVLEHPRQVIDQSISELAVVAGVSEPTIIRFSRSVGVSGFRELKTRLIANLQRPESYLHHDVDAQDSAIDAAGKVLERSIWALVELREQIPKQPLEAAVEAMATARQLVFSGLGASGIVAEDACHKFFRLGIPCSSTVDSQTILQRAAIAGVGDVHVAISHTGQWPDLVRAMALARRNGATVIALTDPRAPLAEQASLVIECHPPEDTNLYTPMCSRLAQLALLDALQVALALARGEAAEVALSRSKDVLRYR
ncbi:MAG: SIS domain-containing protein [Halieaceae bacterium]|nr:SIS domain-containing protein [Halieaceae bacterium]